MKLFDLIKALDIREEVPESLVGIAAAISLSDKAILIQAAQREIQKKEVRIINCHATQDITPTESEIKSFLNYLIAEEL